MNPAPDDSRFDPLRWQAMLDAQGVPAAHAWIGVLARDDYAARSGTLLLWRGTMGGTELCERPWLGAADRDVAMLLVLDDEAAARLPEQGFAQISALIRGGHLHPYMLMTLDQLEEAGLDDFVEDLGLVFPKH